tara:strand:- start:3487 stop:3801 length:315 start_codon:yes stop_codon:yes gene_type:complete
MAQYKTEAQFMLSVKKYAELVGWLYYHPYDSRKSNAGFPDCVFVRDGRIVFAELKLATKGYRSKPSEYQAIWLEELNRVADNTAFVEVYLWNPDDWDTIESVLK